jgi:hypothetical protein
MKKLMWILVVIIVIAGIGFGSYKVYSIGFDAGEKTGYDTGYSTGEDKGYQSGQRDGYLEGYQTGNDEGMIEGKKIGYTDGYGEGKQDGYQSGYTSGLATGTMQGYQNGYSEGQTAGYDTGLTAGFGHGYTINDPTWAQVLDFLAKDKTDEKPYNLAMYVCSHFTKDVCNNAEATGIRCAVVELRYVSGQGHVIVAFNTIDRGLVYFEPQTDEQANPAIGLKYYKTIIPKPGYYYMAPGYDDTIQDMVVIW